MNFYPHREPDANPVEEVVAQLTPLLSRHLQGFRIDRHLREDIAQDVWLLFLLHRHRIEDPDRTAAWLRTTASRHAMRTVNRSRREVPVDRVDVPMATDPSQEVAREARDRAVLRAIDRLPERDRRLARLIAYYPELTYADIALRLGVAVNSVGQLRRRCLLRLARLLAREGIVDAS